MTRVANEARRGVRTIAPARRLLEITVLSGGPSTEREVSLKSGRAVASALSSLGHEVHCADIAPGSLEALAWPADVVFIALHGAFGENGQVQQLCEDRGLRYIGSGPRASALALDKVASRERFTGAGLKVAKGVVLTSDDAGWEAAEALEDMGLPVVLKPIDGGSSVDVTIARSAAARDDAVVALLDKYGRALAEEFVPGREFTVSILGRVALPVLEIIPAREFYDYAAKYADGSGTRYVFDHGLPPAAVGALQSAALAAHDALGCRDLSRVDFIVTPAGAPVVLEVNTIPGFTGHSLLPMAAARVGLDFPQLVDRIAMMAMARAR